MDTSSIRVSATQLSAICPPTPVSVIAELFADAGEGIDVINGILRSCGIATPQAIAAFLACAIYDSFGLTTFRAEGGVTLTAAEWLYARAQRWHDLKLNDEVKDGGVESFLYIVDATSWGTANFGRRYDLYDHACRVFGVEGVESAARNDQEYREGEIDALLTQLHVRRIQADAEC